MHGSILMKERKKEGRKTKINLSYMRIPNIHGYPSSRIWKLISFSWVWAGFSNTFSKNRMWKKFQRIQWKKLVKTTLTNWSRLTSPVINHLHITCQMIKCDLKASSSLWSSSQKTYNPSLIMKKIRQTQIEEHTRKYLTNTLQNNKVMKNKGKN